MFGKETIIGDVEKYIHPVEINEPDLDCAITNATDKLLIDAERLSAGFTLPETIDYRYQLSPNDQWTSGMNTGVYWLAYELTGNKKFKEYAEKQLKTYKQRLDDKVGLLCHDVGFVYTPSCVADYKITGNDKSRSLALNAAELLMSGYDEKGKIIKRGFTDYPGAYRILVDTMMNIPLLLWAGKETSDEEYTQKAVAHYKSTEKYLVRKDGSTFHHFQFNPQTMEPENGLTLQGYSDLSCWSRGHSWLIYGYPIAYSYTHDKSIFDVHKKVTYYFLSNLPKDDVPYWDLIFGKESTQPRDSSAAAVAVCGLLEMDKYLNDDSFDKKIFKNAADHMMKSLIQNYSNSDTSKDGLLMHVTHAFPQNRGIDESAIYGDYFYLEALLRYKNPDWQMYW